MLNLIRSLIPDGMQRALVLKGARWLGAAAAGAAFTWLINHGVATADATAIAGAIAALILGGASAAYSYLDAKSVDTQVVAAKADGAHEAVATAISSPENLQALTAAVKQGPEALAATLAKLNAGTA